jgi:hypothetical protein
MTLAFLYLGLGLVLANIGYLFTRKKASINSPQRFNVFFWIADNWIKFGNSLIIGVALTVLANIHPEMTTKLLGFEWLAIYSTAFGLFPDAILSFLKSKFKFMQPKKATDSDGTTYDRKPKEEE